MRSSCVHMNMVSTFVAVMESHAGFFHIFSAILLIIQRSRLPVYFATLSYISYQDPSHEHQVSWSVSMSLMSCLEGRCSKDGNKVQLEVL
jgi:hypothetical protein